MKEIARYCGPVPCGVIRKPFKDRVMVIGDAAGMAKPTTGGGIGPGFRQVEAIIEKLVKAIEKDKLDTSDTSVCKPFKAFRKEQDRQEHSANCLSRFLMMKNWIRISECSIGLKSWI